MSPAGAKEKSRNEGLFRVFQVRLTDCAKQVSTLLSDVFTQYEDVPVSHAMAHATAGGKQLRGFFVMESARLYGVDDARSVWAAAAVEAMHAYSLIHDDLPCMDDDTLRRGQPTVHVKWDEATAVLAGDALQALAFELLCRGEIGNSSTQINLIATLARAAGAQGMVLGQAQDIAAETARSPLNLEEITSLQKNKTGALIGWSVQAGAVLAGAAPDNMRAYSKAIGLAFQIADDILDVEGDIEKAGKKVGKDAHAGKATFVSLLGLDGAKARAADLVAEAKRALDQFGNEADVLREAAEFVISREM